MRHLLPPPWGQFASHSVSQVCRNPFSGIFGIVLVVQMRRSRYARAQANSIEGVAYDMHLGSRDITNGIALVRVSEDEHLC